MWEWKEKCQFCRDAEIYYPDLLLCQSCSNTSFGLKLKKSYFRNLEAHSVRTVSGGLPSLGKRR
jgi:hypothetical protein